MARDVVSFGKFGHSKPEAADESEVRSWLPAQATSEQVRWVAKVMDAGELPASEAFGFWLLRYHNPFRSHDEG
jgi:hypothetical protein